MRADRRPNLYATTRKFLNMLVLYLNYISSLPLAYAHFGLQRYKIYLK